MRLLITGAGGFIGQHLLPRIWGLALGDDVFVSTPTEKEMDLRDARQVRLYVEAVRPTHIIHLAARTEVALSFDAWEDVLNVNFNGTARLGEAAAEVGTVKHFIFASTMETYGWGVRLGGAIETDPQVPAAPYGVAKVAAEHYLRYLGRAKGLPLTVLRQTNAYGRTNTDFFVMERIISQMLAGDVVKLGASWPRRNFLYISDLIDLYLAVLAQPDKATGETFVTGPNNAVSIAELVDIVADVLQWGGTVEWDTLPERPGEIGLLNSHPAKARNVLGWEPKVSLREGILRTAEKWRNK